MDGKRFDALVTSLASRPVRLSRRDVGGLALLAGAGLVGWPAGVDARRRKCKRGKKRCDGKCVDLATDEAHCGACDIACNAGQQCCGKACVDVAANPQHCGGCNRPCGSGQTCAGSQCSGGGGGCQVACQNDKICDTEQGFCVCPPSKPIQCEFNSTKCSADPMTDSTRCGFRCDDCEAVYAAGYHCCGGRCVNGCAPATNGSCFDDPCGANCASCGADAVCCNRGVGTTSACIARADLASGFCP